MVLEALNSLPATNNYALEVIKWFPLIADVGRKIRSLMLIDTVDENKTIDKWEN
jgi:hypothetical protein